MIKYIYTITIFICFLGLSKISFTQNLALNKSYSLSERPNYPTTAPEADKTSLTDGKYAMPYNVGKKRYWRQKAFLGWNYKKQVKITIDLEQVSKVNSVIFSTASNGNVQYSPQHIYTFLSTNGDSYYYAGDIANVTYPPHDRPRRLKLVLNRINHKARYVTLIVIPKMNKLFCDEIEVRSNNYYPQIYENVLIADSNVNRLSSAYSTLSKRKFNEVELLKKSLWDKHTAKLINEYNNSFTINKINPWVDITELYSPEDVEDNLNYNLIVPISGVQYGAYTITNTSDHKDIINITFTESECFDIRLYTIPFITDGYNGAVADPLIPINNSIQLIPGETKVLFFELYGLETGRGISIIKVFNDDFNAQLKITGHVQQIFPTTKGFELNVNVWAYLNVSTLKNVKAEAVKDLQSHHVNTAMIEPWFLPSIQSNDFSEFLNYLSNYDSIENIFLRVRYEQRLPKKFLTSRWKENFVKWYNSLCETVHKSGFPYSRIFFYPYDEISGKTDIENYKRFIEWARKALPTMKFVATFNNKTAIKEILPIVDVGIIMGSKDLLKNLPITDAEIWTYYINGNARLKSPYKCYRLMGWKAFYYNLNGIGFWNYSIIKGAKLNKISAKVELPSKNYAVIYNGPQNTIISSRRWEAFKLGIEDYELLKLYESNYGRKNTLELVNRVLQNQNNYDLADEIRTEIINKLHRH